MTPPFFPYWVADHVPHPAVTLVLESGPLTLEPQQVAEALRLLGALVEAVDRNHRAEDTRHTLDIATADLDAVFAESEDAAATLVIHNEAARALLRSIPTAGTPGGLARPQPAGQEAVSSWLEKQRRAQAWVAERGMGVR